MVLYSPALTIHCCQDSQYSQWDGQVRQQDGQEGCQDGIWFDLDGHQKYQDGYQECQDVYDFQLCKQLKDLENH